MSSPTPPADDRGQSVARQLSESAALLERLAAETTERILQAAQMLTATFRTGNKVLLCGNGGSAADCQHMATEFVSRFHPNRQRAALPALALTTDTSFLTAHSNDASFEGVFERQLQAHGKPGDLLIAISTSGNSKNVLRAVRAARPLSVGTIGLVGQGGALTDLVDCAIVVPSRDTQRIQEALLCVEHVLCDLTETALFP
jgi:D-sedoheptulose 7-phosphate isomerase